MQTEYEFDVFISYSSRDKVWVRGELLTRIEQAGLKAFIDFRDFTRGAPSIKECERGVLKCRKTLLILTPSYIESEWCEFEGVMAQTLSPANRDLRLIPLLKAKCDMPLRIGALTHIDFTDGADIDLASRQLLTALGAPPVPLPPKAPERDDWFLAHPYPMPPNFTGRVAERAMLSGWLDADPAHPLLSVRALGGFGKSALAWHWLMHDVAPAAWARVVWWSFYEGDASFDHFLAKTLHYLSGGKIKLEKPSTDDVTTLLQLLAKPGALLLLDGFERVLRAFGGLNAAYQGDDPGGSDHNDRDCISPLADLFLYHVALQPNLWSKILLTTRLCPRVLEAKGGGLLQGCREEELKQMQPADAAEFFRAQGIRGTHTEIETACDAYGYHPLSLTLLAGWITKDPQQPGDITAAKRLDVGGKDEKGRPRQRQRQHHILEVAYDSLTPERQTLLSRIACFRSPVKYDALKALAEAEPRKAGVKTDPPLPHGGEGRGEGALDADVRDLVGRGLLHHDTKESRFDLHPIVRRYAYDRLAAPDRAAAHTRLRDYFAAVPPPDKVTRLEDLAPVIELYHHTVRAGQFDEAFTLLRWRLVPDPLYYQFGAYRLIIDLMRSLFPDGEDHPPRVKVENDQALTFNELANSYALSGQPGRAVPLCQGYIAISEKLGDKANLAVGLGNVAMQQLVIGGLRVAEANVHRRIALGREIKDEYREAIGQAESGRQLSYRGAYAESETELATGLRMFERLEHFQMQGVTWAYRALRELLRLRSAYASGDLKSGISNSKSPIANGQSALPLARRALELADETTRTSHPYERDYVRAHWLLGAAHRVAGQTDEAERHLHEALERCRRINAVDGEADILVDLARLRAATDAADEAQRLATEALVITERSGYVLQGADAHLELAKLALARGDKAAALEHAKEARRLATCDGPPDYTYKAAYEEAGALLAELERHREGSGGARSK